MMFTNMRRAFLVVVFSAIAGAGSSVWADHGHGGGHGGRGFDGDHGHVSFGRFDGGHGSFGHFDGHREWGGRWGLGSSIRFNSGYFGWPSYYRSYYYRPYSYSYFGYPYIYGYGGYPTGYYGYPTYYNYSYPSDYNYSYPSDCCAPGGDDGYADASSQREYLVSRPVSNSDFARVEFRLPDPQATILVQGKEIASSGTVRQFQSPQLDPTQHYTYTVKAQWRDNGKLFEDERQVNVQPNSLAVVDFTPPTHASPDAQGPVLSDLPPPRPKN